MTESLTNSRDLKTLMLSCKTCSSATQHGRNIIHHSILPHKRIRTGKLCALIVNTKSPLESVGHWFCLLKFNNVFTLVDGVGYTLNRPDVMNNIKKFCRLNNSSLYTMKLRFQKTSSFKCGFLAMAIIAKYHSIPSKQFHNLENILKRNSITFNEKFLLDFCQKHFSFSI